MDNFAKQATRPDLVLCDLSAAPLVDMHGAQMLVELHRELAAAGCRLQLVEARSSVRDRLRLEGVEDQVGRVNRFTTVAEALDDRKLW